MPYKKLSSNCAITPGVPYSGRPALSQEVDRHADLYHDQGHGTVRSRQGEGNQVNG